MKQYKIKRIINGELEVVGFEYHYENEVCHKKRRIEIKTSERMPGEFPRLEGDTKEEIKDAT
jgi:hypothetical protein